jgi:hypothetical protein
LATPIASNEFISKRKNGMEWEKPGFVEISLAGEIRSYANTGFSESQAQPANE